MSRNTSNNKNITPEGYVVVERQTHDYTDELELKSLLIREKNKKTLGLTDETRNKRINELVALYRKLKEKNSSDTKQIKQKKSKLLVKLKERIVNDSEITAIDNTSRERFGEIVLLMVKNILKKRNFAGYTWKDEFYSEACHNVFKYIYNFNHKLISNVTGQSVNSFSYVSQIIHNAIILVITNNNKNKKITEENLVDFSDIQTFNTIENKSSIDDILEKRYNEEVEKNTKILVIDNIEKSLYGILKNYNFEPVKYKIYIPKDYKLSLDEYEKIKPYIINKDLLRIKE